MTLLETLILTIGTAVAKSILDVWLKDDPIAGAVAGSTLDVIKSKTSDILVVRKVTRQFDALADRVAASLEPLFRSYVSDAQIDPTRSRITTIWSSDNENRGVAGYRTEVNWEAVATEVSLAISDAHISAQLLAKLSQNPVSLGKYIKSSHPSGGHLFSETESALYSRSIELAAQYIVELAPNLPNYTSSNFTEVLARLDVFMSKLDDLLTNLDRLRTTSEESNEAKLAAEFETDYRTTVIRKLDRVELLGMDLSRDLKRYPLSVAYISLEVRKRKTRTETREESLSVEEALVMAERSVIVGEAGSGKTTLLKWLAIKSAENSFPRSMSVWANSVPFFIELRRFTDGLPSPDQFLDQIASEITDTMPSRWVHDALMGKRAVLLIDGLDEVSLKRRQRVLDWLEGLLDIYKGIRVVLTSRPAAYTRDWLKELNFREFTLEPMEYGATEMFVEYWHRAVLIEKLQESEAKAMLIQNKLLEKLRSNFPLMRLATNPLLCAMLCALHYDQRMHLPADRNTLYEKCIEMLLERRDLEREVTFDQSVQLQYKQKRVLLNDIAYWMIKNGQSSIEASVAESRITVHLSPMGLPIDKASDVLKILVERSGLLRAPSEDTLDFVHRTFQEYMAAEAASNEPDWGLLASNASDDQWQDTIILAVGFANQSEASDLIGKVLDLAEKQSSKRVYLQLLAISCLETAKEVNDEVRQRVKNVLSALIPSQDRKQDRFIAAAGDLAVPYLVSRDKLSSEEATSCIGILGMIGTRSALIALGTFINDSRQGVVDAILKVFRAVSPKEILASGLSVILVQSLVNSIDNGCLRVDGDLLYAVSAIPSSEQESFVTLMIDRLEIRRFRPDHLSHLGNIPFVNYLVLQGDLNFDMELLSIVEPKLETLELWNKGNHWPDFSSARHMHGISRLCLGSNPDAQLDFIWPEFSHLSQLGDLSHLELFSHAGDELPDLEELEALTHLEHLHLAIFSGTWPNLDPLNEVKSLRTLELTFPWKKMPTKERLVELSEVRSLRKLILNADKIPDGGEKIISDSAKFVGVSCVIEIKSGARAGLW